MSLTLLAFASLCGGSLLAAPPIAPTGLTGFVSGTTLVLRWNDNSTDETVFQVTYTVNGSVIFLDLPSDTTTTTGSKSTQFSGLSSGTLYTFAIRARNAGSEVSAYTNTISVTPSSLGAPSALSASALPNGSVQLGWIDNAAAEEGFLVDVRLLPSGSFVSLGTLSPNSLSINITPLAPASSYEFRIRAYTGTTTAASNAASVTTPAFPAPNNLVATPLPNTSVQLTWLDNTNTEAGFLAERRELPGGSFVQLGWVDPNSVSVLIPTHDPAKQYEFRLRAFTGTFEAPITLSAYSNVTSVTSFLVAPSGLTATPEVNGNVTLSWVDNAASENGFVIESRTLPGGSFAHLVLIGPNIQAISALKLNPSTQYEYRLRAFTGAPESPSAITAYSNTASVTTAVLAPPSNFTATAVPSSPYQVSFSWIDNTAAEFGYEIEYRKQGTTNFTRRLMTNPNDTSEIIPEWEPGTAYDFRIRAANGSQVSAYSAIVSAITANGFSSPRYAPATVGSTFSIQLATLGQAPRASWSADPLPDGLVFDSQTGIISGNPSTSEVFMVPLTATFGDSSTHTVDLELRILAPPQITTPIAVQSLLPGANTTVALATSFSTPGTQSAVRLATNKGNIDILLSTVAPLTVANFLGYVGRGDYANVLFHRAPLGFVLQGGGFRTFAAPDVFERIPSAGNVVTEPFLSNLTGTVAMAKVGGDPNSATSEFFFNLKDNSANLDFQNGGFTVFGRVSVPTFGGAVATLSGLDRYNYRVRANTPAGAVDTIFTDLPVDQSPASATIDPSKIPKILSAVPVPVLTYALTANSSPAVATATLNGASLQINGLTSGTSMLTVTATDLDGNSSSQTIAVQVQQTFAQWAAAKQIPNGQNGVLGNPDQDTLSNLLEFAFFGNPIVSDSVLPVSSLAADAGSGFLEITFPVNKLAAGLTYRVEASASLQTNNWGPLWTSSQGFSVPVVTAAVDQPDRTLVTVRDTNGSPGAPRRFLRVSVTQSP